MNSSQQSRATMDSSQQSRATMWNAGTVQVHTTNSEILQILLPFIVQNGVNHVGKMPYCPISLSLPRSVSDVLTLCLFGYCLFMGVQNAVISICVQQSLFIYHQVVQSILCVLVFLRCAEDQHIDSACLPRKGWRNSESCTLQHRAEVFGYGRQHCRLVAVSVLQTAKQQFSCFVVEPDL